MIPNRNSEPAASLLVIVNADDFGLTRGVNASIVACHRAGSLTSATLMANMEATEDAAMLAAGSPDLGVGLHFNITQGAPLSAPERVTSLIDADGQFMERSLLLRRALAGRINPMHVLAELNAQHGRIRELGITPSHFDSHQHAHAIPVVFKVVAEHAKAMGLPVRVPRRWPGRSAGKSLRRRLSEVALQAMVGRCLALAPAGLATNDGLCSIFDLQRSPSALKADDYVLLLAAYATGVVELMVHPGVADGELSSKTAIAEVSAVEDRLLRTDFIRAHVSSRGGKLVTYRDVV